MSWPIRVFYLPLAVLATTAHGASNECDCYLTNGTNSAYYSRHDFYDYRGLGEYAGVPSPAQNASRTAAVTSDYFNSDTWNNAWSIQDWNNRGKGVSLSGDATVLMVNSPNNIYIQKNDDKDAASDTFLTMRTMRLPDFQSTSEFDSISTYHFVSVRMLARVTGNAGACMAIFTYLGGKELAGVQADIEIMTRDPRNRIQYTNQPSFTEDDDDIPKATRNATLPKGLQWDNWVVHRLDWTPKRSTWYADGQEVASIEFQTPKDPAQIILNAWSDGGSWSGNMSLDGAAYMQIQWIDMVYNVTRSNEDKRSLRLEGDAAQKNALMRREDSEDGCKVVCSIDETDKAGETKILWKSTASHMLSIGYWTTTFVLGLILLNSLDTNNRGSRSSPSSPAIPQPFFSLPDTIVDHFMFRVPLILLRLYRPACIFTSQV
ncbi:xyloglucan endo-transglycosylase [Fusarium beomiforme]|uniref:Xyloglucan endo-transglycosylase n=1 Tax=Fusarium beomiforme TaxID=44412 RepID=A0A9P5AQC5_9HYPO|nr:xyloglucan endo-transglycosylase [Fusarium beomiforme]